MPESEGAAVPSRATFPVEEAGLNALSLEPAAGAPTFSRPGEARADGPALSAPVGPAPVVDYAPTEYAPLEYGPPAGYGPPTTLPAAAPRRLPLALGLLALVAVLSLGVAAGTLLSRRGDAAAAVVPAVQAVPAGTDGAAAVRIDGPADELRMADTTTGLDDGMMESDPMEPAYRPAPPSGSLEATVPDGVALAQRAADGTPVVSVQRGTWRRAMPGTLSPATRLDQLTYRLLAGRHTVEIGASDSRWTTTYYWDYGANVLHFVAQERATGAVNVSTEPGTAQVMQAALGYVPAQTYRTRVARQADARYRSPARHPSSPAVTAPAYVILGAYLPGDEAGYQERLAQVRASGRDIQTTMSETLGMSRSGYRLLYLGPFARSAADRVLAEMRSYAVDAYLRSVR